MLIRIDATTGQILARVVIPSPKHLASDGRSVWVLSDEGASPRLVRIDAATNAVTETFDADAVAGATRLAAAGGYVWFGDDDGGAGWRLATGASAAEPVDLAVPAGGFRGIASGPVAAAGSIWVSSYPVGPCCVPPPDLYRIDPATGRMIARIDGADRVVASGTGFVWALVADHPDADKGALVRIETKTHATARIGTLDFQWTDLTVAAGAVWASSLDGTIRRLDPVTGEETERISAGQSGPWLRLAAGAGAVWGAIPDGVITRYDIAEDVTRMIYVGGTPTDIVFAHDSVWVTVDDVFAGGDTANQTAAAGGGSEALLTGRQALTVDGVAFSFRVPSVGWERFGSISINKSTAGPQDAEAMIFWTSFPDGDHADPCANLLSQAVGRSAADLAAVVSTAPGTELVTGPSDVSMGGLSAKHVVLRVRENVGCDPGFFYTWQDWKWGALWPETRLGDTIRVWIVDVDGTRLFIEAETHRQADLPVEFRDDAKASELELEIKQIVESIRFRSRE